jgi:hypothetical protein
MMRRRGRVDRVRMARRVTSMTDGVWLSEAGASSPFLRMRTRLRGNLGQGAVSRQVPHGRKVTRPCSPRSG